jgi:hypothetical protein
LLFFRLHTFAHSLHTFDAVEHLRQVCAMCPSFRNRADRVVA